MYTAKVGSTVLVVIKKLNFAYPYWLVWQSKDNSVPWSTPKTHDVIKGLVAKGTQNRDDGIHFIC